MNNSKQYDNPQDIKKLNKAIESIRKKLIAKVASKDIYENFGVKEIMELKDKFNSCPDYCDMLDVIQNFSDWCGWYNGR